MVNSNKNYVNTERAHYMCPNMHFGILAQIKSNYDKVQVMQSVKALQKAHPFLRSLIAEEKDTKKLYYQLQEHLDIILMIGTDPDWWQQDYNDISSHGWDVRKECMLKVLVYPNENEFQILFISHHLLCDGRGLLQLVVEFAQHYGEGVTPSFVEEQLIQSIYDLPANCDLPFISKFVINDANRRWKKEQHQVLYDTYLNFEKSYIRTNSVRRGIHTIEGQEFEEIQALCKQHGFSVNDYLIAKMMREDNVRKVIIAADIRHQAGCYRENAMGNYSTAFSVSVKKGDKDMISLAKEITSIVEDIVKHPQKEMLVLACYLHMQPELIDAVAISTLGGFESKAGAFVGKNMFGYGAQKGYSITNLGKFQSDVIANAVFIPPASPANKKTWGVLTVNDCMKICSSILFTER